MQRRVLTAHRVGNRILQAAGALPLARRADLAVAADLIDAPIDLEPVIVGIAEFDGDLTAGAAPAVGYGLLIAALLIALWTSDRKRRQPRWPVSRER